MAASTTATLSVALYPTLVAHALHGQGVDKLACWFAPVLSSAALWLYRTTQRGTLWWTLWSITFVMATYGALLFLTINVVVPAIRMYCTTQ